MSPQKTLYSLVFGPCPQKTLYSLVFGPKKTLEDEPSEPFRAKLQGFRA